MHAAAVGTNEQIVVACTMPSYNAKQLPTFRGTNLFPTIHHTVFSMTRSVQTSVDLVQYIECYIPMPVAIGLLLVHIVAIAIGFALPVSTLLLLLVDCY